MYNNMVGKDNFTLEYIIMYSPQRDKVLNTYKKEVRNGGTVSQFDPKKISPKYTQSKPIVKINFDIKVFSRGNSVEEIQ